MKRSEEEVRPGADFQAGFLFFITIEFSQSVHFIVHDNRMFAERAFYCYGIYPVEGIGVFRVPKNGDARNKKPPALRVETKRCTKKSPFRYNRVVQALL